MNQDELIKIANSQNGINTVRETNTQFLGHIAEQDAPQDIPAEININDEALSIDCFGYKANSKQKIVKSQDDNFYYEYIFIVFINDLEIEVYRFYLDSTGNLLSSIDPEEKICDYLNRYISKEICGRVVLGALDSKLFQHSE